jgi:hypothetical protein
VVAAWERVFMERVFMERGWMPEMSVMEMPCGHEDVAPSLGANGGAVG